MHKNPLNEFLCGCVTNASYLTIFRVGPNHSPSSKIHKISICKYKKHTCYILQNHPYISNMLYSFCAHPWLVRCLDSLLLWILSKCPKTVENDYFGSRYGCANFPVTCYFILFYFIFSLIHLMRFHSFSVAWLYLHWY